MKTLQKLLWSLAVFILLVQEVAWAAYPAEVPRTGQTACYDDNGTEIDCTGTGQDGELQAGVAWPDPRFVDNFAGTVTDRLTGLEWTKDTNPAGFKMTWPRALSYIKRLNRQNYLGHTDWRLPNMHELESLVDAGRFDPAFPQGHPFKNMYTSYWSSSTPAWYAGTAPVVNMDSGDTFYSQKVFDLPYMTFCVQAVWPVRSGQCGASGDSAVCLPATGQNQCFNIGFFIGARIHCAGTGQDGELQAGVAWPEPRFIVNDDNSTVTDSLTGLEWAKNANPSGVKMDWQQALDYVNTFANGGHTDWRLPNIEELRSLVDHGRYHPALPQDHPFSNLPLERSDGYWSSTSCAFDTRAAWIMDLSYGTVDGGGKKGIFNMGMYSNLYYAWPVRGGNMDNAMNAATATEP